MKIERIREILNSIPTESETDDDRYDDQSETWTDGYAAGIAESLKFLEVEAMTENTIFTPTGNCTILGDK